MLSLCIAEADCPSSYGLAYKISGILWLTLSSETIPIWLEKQSKCQLGVWVAYSEIYSLTLHQDLPT